MHTPPSNTQSLEMLIMELSDFPPEINIRISSFLSVPDVVNFQSSCKYLQKTISLNILENAIPFKINDIHESGDYRTGDRMRLWTKLPSPILQTSTHTVKVTCSFKDQGWGNRKGNLFITEFDNDREGDDAIGQTIVTSPRAEHHETFCELEFSPKIGVTYALTYRVGGGGGHELYARSLKVVSYVHSAAAPLANKLSPCLPDPFIFIMIKSMLDTVAGMGGDGGEQATQQLLFLEHFQSLGLDLLDRQHADDLRVMLQEFESLIPYFGRTLGGRPDEESESE
jgi:hypothetical protein